MSEPARLPKEFDEASAEAEALEKAVAEARADARAVPHEEMRSWLHEIAEGNFDAPAPHPRRL